MSNHKARSFTHPSYARVIFLPLPGQITQIIIEPKGRIPMHSHDCDAEFTVVAGFGWYGTTETPRDQEIAPGDHIKIKAGLAHAFVAGEAGMALNAPQGKGQ